jgi:cell division protein FtsI (penicillin-binding protein 3)
MTATSGGRRAPSAGRGTAASRPTRARGKAPPARRQAGAAARRPAGARRPARRRGPRRGDSGRRLLVVLALTMVAFLAISTRLVVLQVLDAPSLDKAAAMQRLRAIELPAARGRIFDRDGDDLALSAPARTVYAQPRLVKDPAATARKLAPLLGVPARTIRARLDAKTPWTYLARKLPVQRGDAVARLALPGIGVLGDTMRRYPSGALASQLIGFVGDDGSGLAGVEQRYDQLLRGHAGQMMLEQDPSGRPIPQGQRSVEPATQGADLVLTIDQELQYVSEQALAQAVKQYRARAGSVVVMAPGSGEILALANVPTFDPNRFASSSAEARKNRAVTDVYEPGSTNKVITAAAALDAGVVTPKTPVTVPPELQLCNGVHPFHDSHEHGTERLSFAEVVAQSSNIGTIKVASQLGAARLAKAERDFGYGRRTGVDLPGESPGIVTPAPDWTCADLGTNAMGQGVAVTVLQMARVYAAVANGGLLVQPTLLRGTVDARGRYEPAGHGAAKRVLSAQAARTLTGMLEGVVKEGGTGMRAALDDWGVAGKTGTAQVPDPKGRGYLAGAYVASFIGFAPSRHPRVVVAVVLDRPASGTYGGVVAAPVFREVAGYALRRMGVPPTLSSGGGAPPASVPAPDGDVPGGGKTGGPTLGPANPPRGARGLALASPGPPGGGTGPRARQTGRQ